MTHITVTETSDINEDTSLNVQREDNLEKEEGCTSTNPLVENITNEFISFIKNHEEKQNSTQNTSKELKRIRRITIVCFASTVISVCIILIMVFYKGLQKEPTLNYSAKIERKIIDKKIEELETAEKQFEEYLELKDKKIKALSEESRKSKIKFKASLEETEKKLKNIQDESRKSQKILKAELAKVTRELRDTKEASKNKINKLETKLDQREDILKLLRRDGIVNKNFIYPIPKTASKWFGTSLEVLSVSLMISIWTLS